MTGFATEFIVAPIIMPLVWKAVRFSLRGKGGLVLYKMGSVQAEISSDWRYGDHMIWWAETGSTELGQAKNTSILLEYINKGLPVRESFIGNVPSGSFLDFESNLLTKSGYKYNKNI